MTRTPDLTIVVVTYNSAHVIGGLLDSLVGPTSGISHETIVVDNDSSDGTRELVAGRPDCELVHAPNTGYAGGINRGVDAARGSGPVLVLNPDVRVRPDSVPYLLAVLADPAVGIVVPQLRDPDGSLQYSLRREPSIARMLGLTFTGLAALSESCNRPADYETAHAVDWATGAAMLVRRSCFEALGGLDESYFMYSEEVDFCLRARDAGFVTWYEPAAIVEHMGQGSGSSDALYVMQAVNRVRLYRRRHRTAAAWLFWLTTLSNEAAHALLGGPEHRRAASALVSPARRPPQIGCSTHLVPR